jgi:hypothetical protein
MKTKIFLKKKPIYTYMIIIFYWKIDLCKMQYITLKKTKKSFIFVSWHTAIFMGGSMGVAPGGDGGDMSPQ